MRVVFAAAVAASVAASAAADDMAFDIATMRSFEAVMAVSKLEPTTPMAAYRLFECAVAESKKIAERPALERVTSSIDGEADEAMAACQPRLVELAKVAPASQVAAIITAVLRANAAIIHIARSPRSAECARPEDAYCLVSHLR